MSLPEKPTRAVVSVAEMSSMIGLSRSRFYSLIQTGVFPQAIRQYPTPVTLRAYSKVFIFSFPVLYGPYFEFIAESFSHGLEYMMPILFSFILVSLDNIQEHLENPFDQVGEDDVHFDVERFMGRLK